MPAPPPPASPSQQSMQQFRGPLLPIQEVSRRSGISAPTLTRLARTGELPAQRHGRGWVVAWPLPAEVVQRVARHGRSGLRRGAEQGEMAQGERERALWRALEQRDANVAAALQVAAHNSLAVERLSGLLERS